MKIEIRIIPAGYYIIKLGITYNYNKSNGKQEYYFCYSDENYWCSVYFNNVGRKELRKIRQYLKICDELENMK